MAEPKQANHKPISFEDFDKLKLKSYGENLYQVIEKGLSSSIGEMGEKRGWTLSLNAPFGNGKTTFLKMFEHFIKTDKSKDKETQKQGYNVLFINAWESDFYKEPVIGILSELVKWLKEDQTMKSKDEIKQKNEIINQVFGIIGSIGINTVNQLIKYTTSLDIKNATTKVIKDSKKISNCLKKNTDTWDQTIGQNLLDSFEKRHKAVQGVKDAISKYITVSNKKLLIIIDELDRARPDYAVHFLEDMKHFFDIENVVFLVAVNRQQMEATVKCLYGHSLDFEGYYRKFFKQEMELPDPYKQAQKFVDNLIKKTKVKFKKDNRESRVKNAYTSCKMFNLTLREVETFIGIFEMVLNDKEAVKWACIDTYSFFICLYLKRNNVFKRILEGDFTVDNFISFIKEDSTLKFFLEEKDNTFQERYVLHTVTHSFLKKSQAKKPSTDQDKKSQTTKTAFEKDKETIKQNFPWFEAHPNSIDLSDHPCFQYNKKASIDICEKINQRQKETQRLES